MKITMMLAGFLGFVHFANADQGIPVEKIPQVVEALQLQMQLQIAKATCVDRISGTPVSADAGPVVGSIDSELSRYTIPTMTLSEDRTELTAYASLNLNPNTLNDAYTFGLSSDAKTLRYLSFIEVQSTVIEVNTGTIVSPVLSTETEHTGIANYYCTFSN